MTDRKAQGWQTTTDVDENWARDVVTQVLGIQARRTDRCGEGGDGRTDLAFNLPYGLGIAEVVSTRDTQAEALGHVIARKRYIHVPDLRWLWVVALKPPTRVADLHARLPHQLRQLEELGLRRVSGPVNLQLERAWVTADLLPRELQTVPDCFAIEPSHDHPPGYIFRGAVGGGTPGNGDRALEQIEEFMSSKPDKAEKLGREADRLRQAGTDVPQRHLVVLLEPFCDTSEAAFRFLLDSDNPASLRAPILQEGVTGLWLIPLQSYPPDPVLRWTTESRGWIFDRVVIEQRS